MNERYAQDVLERVGAIITDSHIVYTSGRHGSAYINKDALYPHTRETSNLCCEIAERFSNDSVDVVIAPAVGGVILSQWVAYHLTEITGREVLGVYADKDSGRGGDGFIRDEFVIKRGYDKLIAGANVLVVEDLLTTGGSVRKVVAAVRAEHGNVVGVGVLCNRGGVTPADIGGAKKLVALVNIEMKSMTEEECTSTGLCAKGIPVNTIIGHGKEFLARREA
ncbi:hypothetical protein A3I46_01950 [Candidatus Kaiserbacteria bacterium RIFCSPLOWO2_02_FULL_54_13]|uniref:Orotate phosphoribosyltransferase n=1 Tax=Candidatus Kaiserbacteria bacterium RIFCSPHIGHO2_02_FULL_54_22 TaxID=1798495 RepID=A0A1F6DKJ3_9BACT|nr:MAG: Orotate phosphoribosyltransferase [Parcubacteria group bacterium GW2011_GWA1_54_9]OGG61955.1 MAG: hypothetical protein A3C19_00090 [Candidatus Kaiserbacteria bacterium RIFCSPHIGHO2_02_FULL_54_22]OGG67950.1 MAG: hypothetical protein A3E99_01295 [Candidatus Kaiserbacteria bacterium RIFCSPHIGHO2_12_FULL_54_16]OGG84099.1 MAG: hypothetical protein A3I46_01950 [Candidatus Kaiserbacteria bacterium RIFCSPLOWO2_02_FULL_54_13]OGG90007.1 MAG: hypothetical protein A3G12_00265 [Candidatus Kaiserbact